jgi:WD40 repeat protein
MRQALLSLAVLTIVGTRVCHSGQDPRAGLELSPDGPRLVSQLGHASALNAVSFSSDGTYVLTGSQDGTVRLWHRETGLEIRTYPQVSRPGPEMSLFDPVFSPSGKEIATGGLANHAYLWDVATGREIRRFSSHRDIVGAVAFSPDGSFLLTGSADGSAALWDRHRSRPLHRFSGGFASDKFVGFSSDGRYVVTAGSAFQGPFANQDVLVIWSMSGEELSRLVWDGALLQDVTISEVAPLLAVATLDGTVALVSLESGEAVGELRDPGVTAVSFLPDGHHLVTANGQSATLWSLASGRAVGRLRASGHDPVAVAASRDGRYVVTGGKDRTARLWAVESLREQTRLEGKASEISALAFSPDGRTLYTATPHQSVSAWSLESGRATSILQPRTETAAIALSPDGKYAALAGGGQATVVDLATGKEIQRMTGPFEPHSRISFSPDGTELTAVDHGQLTAEGAYAPRLRKWSVADGRELEARSLESATFTGVVHSPDGHYMAMAYTRISISGPPRSADGPSVFAVDLSVPGAIEFKSHLVLVDLLTGKRAELEGEFAESLAFSPKGQWLASGHIDGTAQVWSTRDGRELMRLTGHPGPVSAVAFSPTKPYLVTGSADLTRVWDVKQGREIARLLSPAPDAWTVVEPEGRFDSWNLDAVQGLHWVIPEEPLTPLPLEIFMRDYYEPRLLPRLLAGERLPPIRDLTELNRLQPQVAITRIDPVPDHADQVHVSVEVESQSRMAPGQGGRMTSGVYDLRLFRDGRLVAQWPLLPEKPSGQLSITTPEALRAWQDASIITRDGRAAKQFTVRLPHQRDLDTVVFTAYAFNADRIKSLTARKMYEPPVGLAPIKGRAYVISVGVTTTQDPYWTLDFAGADARLLRDRLTSALRHGGAYASVVPVTLVNRPVGPFGGAKSETPIQPTKANIRGVLKLLAGGEAAPAPGVRLPDSVRGQLQPVAPQDLVILSFAAHGVRDAKGLFFVLPYDIGSGSHGLVTEALRKQAISSEELSLWLRGVDAQVVLILETCYSSSAVEGGGFKPGPLGDRGLGQLAYDKGMPVLVSSQSSSWEVGGHGLLAYALAIERLGTALRPSQETTLTDALTYAAARVPILYAERIGRTEEVEQPTLFNFKRREKIVLKGGRAGVQE